MSTQKEIFDIVNAIFELTAGFFLMLNVREIIRVKKVIGVRIAPAMFFTLWGMWNVLYYPSIAQTWSFYASLLVVVSNGAWVVLALIYHRRHKLKVRT